ncbi:uncharacterized protein BO95DRAFT_230585 [Aspergillus brunneoviolaceus CBS 621.78]|uniref:Uncharacterized protein n=1 Tax=Aspergillus brunneoviolaceus CBS 621.78 TaxID=1450534 RepID=A0ACD1G0A6_9EURO|nr:hypothetical protein BO95DRAFT_230585 [Aspergillus brunneoviolaceus CBS 621.78]RAH42703.1 hypothetical protein BO95DRAFT_230585 [Aspergillus brunneoviolaceus CBS 621.78]
MFCAPSCDSKLRGCLTENTVVLGSCEGHRRQKSAATGTRPDLAEGSGASYHCTTPVIVGVVLSFLTYTVAGVRFHATMRRKGSLPGTGKEIQGVL